MDDQKPQEISDTKTEMTDADHLTGRVLDERYQVDLLVGEGGMGAVYRARQLRLRRTVALKIPKGPLADNSEFLARFEREALTMAKVVHENIVQIFDVFIAPTGSTDPSFIAMEFVEGAELHRFLRDQQGELTVRALLELLRQIGRALDVAHAHGIVHRDIKPSNIVVTMPQRIAKIMDFGIARVDMEDVFKTKEVSTIGTPAYMPPEQARGGAVTPAADVYAFAGTIYHLLTGALPFDAKGTMALLQAHALDTPLPATERNGRLPPAVDAVLLKALSKDPEERHPSAGALVEELQAALSPVKNLPLAQVFAGRGVAASATAVPFGPEVRPPSGSGGWAKPLWFLPALGAGMLVLIVGVGSAVMLVRAGAGPSRGEVSGVTVAQADLSPSAEPTTEPTDSPTASRSPSPVHSPLPTEPPAPSPEATPSPTPSLQVAADGGFSLAGSKWDVAARAPLTETFRRTRQRALVEQALDEDFQKPLFRGQVAVAFGAIRVQEGTRLQELRERLETIASTHRDVAFSLQLREESAYWENAALIVADYTIAGRPANQPDPRFRSVLEKSSTPVRLLMEKNGETWSIVRVLDN